MRSSVLITHRCYRRARARSYRRPSPEGTSPATRARREPNEFPITGRIPQRQLTRRKASSTDERTRLERKKPGFSIPMPASRSAAWSTIADEKVVAVETASA